MIAFLRSWSNGRIPQAFFNCNTASKSSAPASAPGSQNGDQRIISQTHAALRAPGQRRLASAPKHQSDCSANGGALLIHSAKVRLDMLCSEMDREIHLHKCILCLYTPMSFSLCPLCPFKSFMRRAQHIVNIVTAVPGTSCCI